MLEGWKRKREVEICSEGKGNIKKKGEGSAEVWKSCLNADSGKSKGEGELGGTAG